MVIKKRKAINLVEKHTIQTNVCSSLKAVFFSKDEASIKRSVQHLSELFTQVKHLLENYYDFLNVFRFLSRKTTIYIFFLMSYNFVWIF